MLDGSGVCLSMQCLLIQCLICMERLCAGMGKWEILIICWCALALGSCESHPLSFTTGNSTGRI